MEPSLGIILVFLLAVVCGGILPGVMFALLGIHVYLYALDIELTTAQWAASVLLGLCIPVSAYLVGAVFDAAILPNNPTGNLRRAITTGAVLLVITSSEMLRFFGDSLLLVKKADSSVRLLEVLTVAGSGVGVVVMMITLVTGIVVCSAEIPLRWIASAGRVPISLPYESCRELIIVAFVLFAWNFGVTLVYSELSPLSIVARMH